MHFKKLTVLFSFVILLTACGDGEGDVQSTTPDATGVTIVDEMMVDESNADVTIAWDEWGVPHISADDLAGSFYGLGWSHMQLHGDLILELYGRARGRAAEYWGSDYLERDQMARTLGVPARGLAWWDEQGPEYQAYLQAYADGMNDYASAHPEAIDEARTRALPVLPTDILSHGQMAIQITFMARSAQSDAAGWAAALQASNASPVPAAPIEETSAEERGSNAWAVAPSRSESGNALLLANPHLPWFDLFFFTEAQMTAPDLNLYGVTLVGMPFTAIGFNDHLGWTHTVNTYDGMDLYELTLTVTGQYMLDGAATDFDVTEEIIRVRNEDGSFSEQPFRITNSVFGPMFATEGGKGLAIRIAGLEMPNLIQQYVEMGKATNRAEFETAMARGQMPMFNAIYADANGEIGYYFNAAMPNRGSGDWDFWEGIIPGDTTEYLWTAYHDFAELPQYTNPASGFVQNANDPPWTSTMPQILTADQYPAYFAPQHMAFRPQHSARLVMSDDSMSLDEMIVLANDTNMDMATRILPELLEATDGIRGLEPLARGRDVLAAWDGTVLTPGAALFSEWADLMGGRWGIFAEQWDPAEPMSTPRGLADADAAVAALVQAVLSLEEQGFSADVAWGDTHRIMYGGHNLPSTSGDGTYGSFRVGGWRRVGGGMYANVSGNTFVAAIEFGDRIQARGYLAYGNATQEGHEYTGNQVPLYSAGDWRDIYFYPEDVSAHTERLEELFIAD